MNDRDPAHIEFHTSPVFAHHGMYFSINQAAIFCVCIWEKAADLFAVTLTSPDF